MRNFGAYLLLLTVFSSACMRGEDPGRATSDSLMAEIFVELHLLQARESLGLPPSGLTRDSVIVHYGLTPGEFKAQMRYYADHPSAFNALQNQITDRIGQESHSVSSY